MHILLIAPNAPPKNSPESIQVGRYIGELCQRHDVTLATTVVERGWVRPDDSIVLAAQKYRRVELRLPFHNLFLRLLHSRLFTSKLLPDNNIWVTYLTNCLISSLKHTPDIVYSRSTPYSSAILGMRVAKALGCPWVMHLSDPWADNPYRNFLPTQHAKDQNLEAECFAAATAITVTTESQREFYARKYPQIYLKFNVSPNVLPYDATEKEFEPILRNDGMLRLVYTGALYGNRRPTVLINALRMLRERDPESFARTQLILIGNMTHDIRVEVNDSGMSNIHAIGAMSFKSAQAEQLQADVLLSIEPDGDCELLKSFFPSKLLDYIATGKPLLAITPSNSETWRLCEEGFGWCYSPSDISGIADQISHLSQHQRFGTWSSAWMPKPLPNRLKANVCVESLEVLFARLIKNTV